MSPPSAALRRLRVGVVFHLGNVVLWFALGCAATPARDLTPRGVELDEPLDAVRDYAEALRDWDEATLRALMLAGGERSANEVDLEIRCAKWSVRLERAAASKFGRAGADQLLACPYTLPSAASRGRELLAKLGEAAVEIDGGEATVKIESERTIELRKVDGQWMLFTPEPDQIRYDSLWELPNAIGNVLVDAHEEVALDIEAGRITSVQDAELAVHVAVQKTWNEAAERDDEGAAKER